MDWLLALIVVVWVLLFAPLAVLPFLPKVDAAPPRPAALPGPDERGPLGPVAYPQAARTESGEPAVRPPSARHAA